MTFNKILFSSEKQDWGTPDYIFKQLDREFHFTLDPCANEQNKKVENYFSEKENGLIQKWSGNVFMNPPYGRGIINWIKKAYDETQNGNANLVVCLIPSRTDTVFWHTYCMKADEIRFVKGRITFVGDKNNSATFPSAIVIFRKNRLYNETKFSSFIQEK